MQKKYFYNLNGIRFILAGLVLLHHVAVVTQFNGISNIYNKIGALKAFGPVSVSLFFALSGFLISFILMSEKNKTNTILLKRFYLSRVLRIFPLYYLIISIHLIIIPHTPLYTIESKVVAEDIGTISQLAIQPFEALINCLYFLILPQVASAFIVATGNPFIPAGHVWSIGVEEIFYLIWPVLLLKYGNNFKSLIKRLFISYYVIGAILLIVVALITSQIITNDLLIRGVTFFSVFVLYDRVTCMFIGAVGAYILLNKPLLLERIATRKKFYGAVFFIILLFAIGARVPILTHEIYCIFFVIILLYFAKENKQYFLENRLLNYLGKISYGIYMYQMMVILFLTHLCKEGYFNYLLLYPLSFVLTIFISSVSYELFEKRFLNLKNKL